jgi:transcriptional regulator with XRE-family HTH domain
MVAQVNSAYWTDFGKRVTLARFSASLTQAQLGHMLSLQRASITNIEGGRQRMSAEQVVKVAEFLNADPAWLLTGTAAWEPVPPAVLPSELTAHAKTLRAIAAAIEPREIL